MATEGEFPKSDGDILYASEVNRLNNINGISILSDTNQNTTTSTSFATVKTITIGGSISGKSIITVCMKLFITGGAASFVQTLDNANKVYVISALETSPTNHGEWLIFTAIVEDGDVIEIQAKHAGGTAGISDLQVFSGISGVTIT